MSSRKSDQTQVQSSAKAGFSERTARRQENEGSPPSQRKRVYGRTRKDPFEAVWSSELEPMLEEHPGFLAITLMEHLQDTYPGQYSMKELRTLQRRVKRWRATKGPAKEVMFRQVHPPGQRGLSDFTRLKRVTITIQGKPLDHLLYHFRLAFSSWHDVRVTQGGESYTALAEGFQNALFKLGGCPDEHRTDSLSAAFKNLSPIEQSDFTVRYEALCRHYDIKASRNNPGQGHENGSIESPHGHLKRRIEQRLLRRGSNDFDSIEAYQAFIDQIVAHHNNRFADRLAIERPYLKPLPAHRTCDFTMLFAQVTTQSTMSVKRTLYTVPSRLSGEMLTIHLYDDRLECFLGTERVLCLARVYSKNHHTRARRVDYRHVIGSLIKKPQAFRYSELRDDLLPTPSYRQIWAYIDQHLDSRVACKWMVGALYLAAKQNCEQALSDYILQKIAQNVCPTLVMLQHRFGQPSTPAPTLSVPEQHQLQEYNTLLSSSFQEVCHAR